MAEETFDDRIVRHMKAFFAEPASATAHLESVGGKPENTEEAYAKACAALMIDLSMAANRGEIETKSDQDEACERMVRAYVLGHMVSLLLRAAGG